METPKTRFTRLGRAFAVLMFVVTGFTGDLGGALVANTNRQVDPDPTEEVIKAPK